MTFAEHPAFDPATPRERQVRLLQNIRAVLPYQQQVAAAWVWVAILDPRAVEGARVALDEMPEADRVFTLSRAGALS